MLLSMSSCVLLGGHCTEMGCDDQFLITLTQDDGGWSGAALELNIDGREVDCAAPEGAGRSVFAESQCDSDVRFSVREDADCTEFTDGDTVGQSCEPNGRYLAEVRIGGVPRRVTVRVVDGGTLAEQTFEPEYDDNQPNGMGCEPTCAFASARLSW